MADHYSQLLGLVDPWSIADVELDVEQCTLMITLSESRDAHLLCPECGALSPRYDHGEIRSWRHLDTMQFKTTIRARLPRIKCATHGVKTVAVPWADAHARWTLLFEAFAIEVMLGTSNVTRAMALLKIGWESTQAIRERAVERGLARRTAEPIVHVGIDEKAFLKGHRYASLATDLDKGRVLDVVEGRKKEDAVKLLNRALPEAHRTLVEAGAMDMWQPFMDAFSETIGAPIVHDKFHVSGYLGNAVDLVRRKEHRSLRKDGDESLTKTKYLWLRDPKHWDADEKKLFKKLMSNEFDVGRAWTYKETFRHFWDFVSVGAARNFFNRWYFRATHSRLAPIIAVAKTLKRHLAGLLAYCLHKITNAVTEGLNSKIQQVKSSARGFRTFAHYRVAILFFCGKLDLIPTH